MLDTGRFPLVSGVELSYLGEREQKVVAEVLQDDWVKASHPAAKELHEKTGNLTEETIRQILSIKKKTRAKTESKWILQVKNKYFADVNSEEMWATIQKVLECYFESE